MAKSETAERRVSYPLLLLTVSLGGVLAPLNSMMLAVALPELRRDFGVGHAEIVWLVSAYLIAMAVAQPLGVWATSLAAYACFAWGSCCSSRCLWQRPPRRTICC